MTKSKSDFADYPGSTRIVSDSPAFERTVKLTDEEMRVARRFFDSPAVDWPSTDFQRRMQMSGG